MPRQPPSRPLRRSLLFVPGCEPRRIERARSADADTVLLDLEDSVAPERKDEARDLVADALRAGGFGASEPAVRVNAPDTPYFDEDVAAVVAAGAAAVLVPKAQDVAVLRAVADRLAELEAGRGAVSDVPPTRLLALVETALGVVRAADLATAGIPRLEALCFGHADLGLDLALPDPDPGRGTLAYARSGVAVAARAGGLDPVDNVCLAVSDEAAFRADAALGAALGYAGKMCIHPVQVRIANEVYTPDAEQVRRAERVVGAWQDARARGLGVLSLDGRMVDAPVVAAAERVLQRVRRAGLAADAAGPTMPDAAAGEEP